jgi:cob(I)alamin adenosyltransferase
MPRLTKIYTRKGDDGTTALGTKDRVLKDSLRVRAYGTVDELNSLIGLAIAQDLSKELAIILPQIQNELFHLGAELSFPSEEETSNIPQIEQKHITALEKHIDQMNTELGPLENFILPGGSIAAATLQLARAVCRRAERRLVSLASKEKIRPESIAYINRLSDALFVMGRYDNFKKGIDESLWDSHA